MTTATANKIPAWLALTDDGVTVTLRYPTELNGIKADKLTLRAPTVRDVRAAQAISGNDAEQREMSLFASLAEPRPLSQHMHFYMAALLTLNDDELARVVAAMREQGATVEIGPLPAGPHSGLTFDFSSR